MTDKYKHVFVEYQFNRSGVETGKLRTGQRGQYNDLWCLSSLHRQGPFSVSLGISSDYSQPITGQVTEVTCPVIGQAQPELTHEQETGNGPYFDYL